MSHLMIVPENDPAAELSGAVLFGILWDELSDLLGSAATAAIMSRAARRALPGCPELMELTIARVDQEFGYVVPSSFSLALGPSQALRKLADALQPLLAELTGQIALRRLEQVPELRNWLPAAPPPPC